MDQTGLERQFPVIAVMNPISAAARGTRAFAVNRSKGITQGCSIEVPQLLKLTETESESEY